MPSLPANPLNSQYRPAWRSRRAWSLLLLAVVLGLALDLGSKAWAFSAAADRPIVLDRERLVADPHHDPTRGLGATPILPADVLGVRLALNRGAVFGVAPDQRPFFIAFTTVAVGLGLIVFGRRTHARQWPAHLALGLALAGGLGNMSDRIAFGVVRDFLQLMPGRRLPGGWTWPGSNNPELMPWVFNLADVLLVVGFIWLGLHLRRVRRGASGGMSDRPLEEQVATGVC